MAKDKFDLLKNFITELYKISFVKNCKGSFVFNTINDQSFFELLETVSPYLNHRIESTKIPIPSHSYFYCNKMDTNNAQKNPLIKELDLHAPVEIECYKKTLDIPEDISKNNPDNRYFGSIKIKNIKYYETCNYFANNTVKNALNQIQNDKNCRISDLIKQIFFSKESFLGILDNRNSYQCKTDHGIDTLSKLPDFLNYLPDELISKLIEENMINTVYFKLETASSFTLSHIFKYVKSITKKKDGARREDCGKKGGCVFTSLKELWENDIMDYKTYIDSLSPVDLNYLSEHLNNQNEDHDIKTRILNKCIIEYIIWNLQKLYYYYPNIFKDHYGDSKRSNYHTEEIFIPSPIFSLIVEGTTQNTTTRIASDRFDEPDNKKGGSQKSKKRKSKKRKSKKRKSKKRKN